ncbi:hypothetical protein [Azospirillum sp. B4]|uniref:hypothetical protein n=1 Tax=Azospirillum sp. B4 TaxID=95605 RepID=UPI0011DD38F6|nr:hypothetical protein [Azospirillum sp. B4]
MAYIAVHDTMHGVSFAPKSSLLRQRALRRAGANGGRLVRDFLALASLFATLYGAVLILGAAMGT